MRAGRPIVLTAFGTLMICAASLAFLVAANAQAPASSQPSIETGWKEISHGESWHGVQFDTQGGVWFHAGASSIKIASLEPYYQTVAVSPNGPKGRFAIVVGYGNEERPGWLLDRATVTAKKLPVPDAVGEFASWSPDGTYVILHTSADEGREELWLLRPGDFQIREVGRGTLKPGDNSCCGLDDWDKGKNRQARLRENSVRWLDANTFSFRLYIRCDPFASSACVGNRQLAAYLVGVDAATGKVTDRPVAPQAPMTRERP